MRIRTLALLTSFAAFACGGDDDGESTSNTTVGETSTMSTTDMTTTSPTTTAGTESGSSSGGETLTTTTSPEESGPGTESESSGPADSSSSGGSETGTAGDCAEYCGIFLDNCNEVEGADPYADEAACMKACEGFSESGLACRIDHLTGLGDPTQVDEAYFMMHCPHADADGTGVCMD